MVLRVALVVYLVLLHGWHPASAQSGQKPQKPQVPTGEERILALEKDVKSLQDSLRVMSNRFASSLAVLDCDTKKFNEVKLDDQFRVFFISCEGIERYLEGHKVQLLIGNPYSFTFRGVEGKLWHGKTFIDAIRNQVELPAIEVAPGTWQAVTVTVNPSAAEDMRSVWLELKANRIYAPTRK